MILGIALGVFAALSIVLYLILKKFIADPVKIDSRLETVSGSQEYNELSEQNKKSLYEKMIQSNVQKLGGFFARITPKRYLTNLDQRLHMAGVYPKVNREKWLFSKFIFTVLILFILGVLLFQFMDLPQLNLWLLLFLFFIIIMALNYLSLSAKVTNRKKRIQNELPDTIDLITVSVEAGLSFDSAVSRYVNSTESDLSGEFRLMLKEVRLGIKKKDALKNVIDRCGVDDLTAFIGAIIQANELGVSITNILRIQSKIIRDKRKQRAREKSMKAPIKLLFPLLFFIFPTIFLVLLGPVIIQLLNMR